MRWIKVLPFPTISSPAIIALAVVLLIICPINGIQAGQLGIKCTEPAVWEGAAVNAIILPYTYTGHGQKPLSETAKELTLLVQMDVLFSMLKYGGVGTTVLSTRKIPSQAWPKNPAHKCPLCNRALPEGKAKAAADSDQGRCRQGRAQKVISRYSHVTTGLLLSIPCRRQS